MSIDLNNVRMNVVETAPTGVVNEKKIFTFSQVENIVTGTYSGGEITNGFLVGTKNDTEFAFSYCQLQNNGRIDNGHSNCILVIGEDGKLRLIERFKWASRGDKEDVNIFKEL
jgi:hypothetical protein